MLTRDDVVEPRRADAAVVRRERHAPRAQPRRRHRPVPGRARRAARGARPGPRRRRTSSSSRSRRRASAPSPDGEELLAEAARRGVDVIGAIPHFEDTREDGVRSVEFAVDLAERHGLRVDAHCDEIDDEQSRFVEVLATRAARSGLRERVTASHTTAMGSYNPAYSYKLHRIIARSGIHMVCNPMVSLHLQGRFDDYPKRRGLTQVKELLAAGINVAFGHDDVMDPWYPARHRQPPPGRPRRHPRRPAAVARRDRGDLPDGHLAGGRGARTRRGRVRRARRAARPASCCCPRPTGTTPYAVRCGRPTSSPTAGSSPPLPRLSPR